MIKIIYIWSLVLINIYFSNGQDDYKVTQPYWPPIDNDMTKKIETGFSKLLNQKCPSKPDTDEFSPIFIVTETLNGTTNPKPSEFIELSTGQIIKVRVECEECNQNLFHYASNDYDVRDFQCATMCTFMAKKIEGECHYGSVFQIGLIFQENFIQIFESCHAFTKLPENPKNLRERMEFIMGHFSRRIREGDEICREKCLAVCMHPQITSRNGNQTVDDSYDMDLFEDQDKVLRTFKKNLCNINLKTSGRVRKADCPTSDSIKIQRLNILLLLLAFIICLWDKNVLF